MSFCAMLPKSRDGIPARVRACPFAQCCQSQETASLQGCVHVLLRNAAKVKRRHPCKGACMSFCAMLPKSWDSIPARAHACISTQCCQNHGTASLQGRMHVFLRNAAKIMGQHPCKGACMCFYAMLPKSWDSIPARAHACVSTQCCQNHGTASLQGRMHVFLRNAAKIMGQHPCKGACMCFYAMLPKSWDSIPARAHACVSTQCCQNHGTASLEGRLETQLPYAQVQLLIVHGGFLEALALQEGVVST